MRNTVTLTVVAISLANAGRLQANDTEGKRIEIKKVAGVLTLVSLGRDPRADASHTYVITHGMNGIDERFFALAGAILRAEPEANVLLVDWTPGAVRMVGPVPDAWAVARQIDPTGDALAGVLIALAKQGVFDPAKATFIGESFGNYVNHRAAKVLRKTKTGTVKRGLLLNPAHENGGYQPPVVKNTYAQSVAVISPSCFDTRQEIADRIVDLETKSEDPFAQHTFGVTWLRQRTKAGNTLGALFGRK